ncbi:MAG: glycosyl hydrolase [Chloroflexi bacterium RBG_19FT_COMBO_50_10]|nr:MAG: glycosyl hydrolase [Chloroflexi bacterium RBG_19FT_COMBO_50_10]
MSKINELIKKMSLEEKVALCTGATPWTTTPVEHLGIPEMTMADGPHGVRRESDIKALMTPSLPATCFPTASCTASTWDVDLIHEMGQALAEECIALKVDVVLGPGANMKRMPGCGRNFEYFSEDPYLAGQMATAFINGVQSKGVGTSLKHFAGNNQEAQRLTISSDIDERTLREIYLPAFETAVKKARPWTVMCAYNKLNGTYCSENRRLLVEILKDEWGFEGLVVSDWGAVHERVSSLKAGLDLEMPGPKEQRVKAVIKAVRAGELDELLLDEAVKRILGIVFKATERVKGEEYDRSAHHALVRRIAAEGMVLLKNNGILPLKDPKRIAVIGRSAKEAHFQGGGSSHINPTQVDVPFDEVQKMAGDARLSYAEGYPDEDNFDQALIDEAVKTASSSETALVFIALPRYKESEGYDRADLDLTRQQAALIRAVTAAQPATVVILNNGAPVVMSEWIDGTAAVLEAWMMGQAGGGAIADILFGKVNPCGKLAETFPMRLADTPAYINYPGEGGEVRYGEGIYIGYRYYDARKTLVEFPFGYGMSYTTFRYDNPRVSAATFRDVDGLELSIDITNTGTVAGKEVVQVYVHDRKSGLTRPSKELKGFVKVELGPGETRTVSLKLDFRAFAYYHPAYKMWITEDGEFDLLFGASSTDIRCEQMVTLQSTMELPCLLNRESTMREWMEDKRGRQVFTSFVQQLPSEIKKEFSEVGAENIGMDSTSFFMDMSLPGRLHFLQKGLPKSPEELVDDMLAEVYSAG